MDDAFQILIDRLRGGQTQHIDEALTPTFLDVQEEELQFQSPVIVTGSAYLSDQELILHLNASTKGLMPCAICNKMVAFDLSIRDFYHTVELNEVRGAIFDFRDVLRETLLLELPKYIECTQGNCPDREVIAPYLKQEKPEEKTTHYPFSNLE